MIHNPINSVMTATTYLQEISLLPTLNNLKLVFIDSHEEVGNVIPKEDDVIFGLPKISPEEEATIYVQEPAPVPSIEEQIAELKAQLQATDYKAIKYAEGWISAEDYADTKAERQKIRDRINELEADI